MRFSALGSGTSLTVTTIFTWTTDLRGRGLGKNLALLVPAQGRPCRPDEFPMRARARSVKPQLEAGRVRRNAFFIRVGLAMLLALAGSRGVAWAASAPVTLVLDASQAPRGILYAHERIPVSPGPLTLVYPKWIPGEHAPSGPLNDLAAIRITAGGDALDWRR